MNQKPLFLAVTLVALLAIGGAFWVMQKYHQEPVVYSSSKNIENGSMRYVNDTVGIAFVYPNRWRIDEGEFAHGKGDGTSSFAIHLTPDDWNGVQSLIGVSHFPLISKEGSSYDHIPITDQLNLIKCESSGVRSEFGSCVEVVNKNGVVYIKKIDQIKNSKVNGFLAEFQVPTGKYIITFSIFNESNEEYQNALSVLEGIVDTVEIR